MLRSFFFVILLFSFNAFACLKITGSVSIDGQIWKLDQKISEDEEYFSSMGSFIFRYRIMGNRTFIYSIHERRNSSLVLVTKGTEEMIEIGKQKEIYAKRQAPYSIITFKFIKL